MLLMGIPTGGELIVLLALAALLFGANKIPELMRGVGQGIREFKKGLREIDAGSTPAEGNEKR